MAQPNELFWSPNRVRRLSFAVALGLCAALIIGLALPADPNSLFLRGDVPGFYAPAKIVCEGKISELYDLNLQREMNNRYWPGMKGSYLSFAYPPYFAQMLSPLCLLSPLEAKILLSLLMLLSLWISVHFFASAALIERWAVLPVAVFSLAFPPVFIAVLAGQNAALSMLLYAAAFYFLSQRKTSGDYAAGVSLGIWFFKPHFALLMLLFMFLARAWRVIGGMLIPLAAYYLLSALSLGPLWPLSFVRVLYDFGQLNIQANAAKIISLPGLGLSFNQLSLRSLSYSLVLTSLVLTGMVFVLAAYRFWASGNKATFEERRLALHNAMLLFGPALVLSSHVLFYDISICLLPLVGCWPKSTKMQHAAVLFLFVSGSMFLILPDALSSAVLTLLALAVFIGAYLRH